MSRIYLTYDNGNLQDGFFAQTQRILAIFSIAKFLKFNYFHSPILDLTITQLDQFQSEQDVKKFLIESESVFGFPGVSLDTSFDTVYHFSIPKISDLLFLRLKYVFSKRRVLVKITNPYRIIEKFPDIYFYSQSFLNKLDTEDPQENPTIVAHIRRGIAIQHIAPGEAAERVLDEDYFVNLICKVVESNPRVNQLVILTDAPENDFFYQPIAKDIDKWEEFNYRQTPKGVLIQGHKFQKIIEAFPGNTTVIRGGDLLQALEIIRSASYFLMSRSSMSFVGALLNKTGDIYYPPHFWHKPLKNWIKCS